MSIKKISFIKAAGIRT